MPKKPSIRAVKILIREGIQKYRDHQHEIIQQKRKDLDQKRQELLDKIRARGEQRAPTIISVMRKAGKAFAEGYSQSWNRKEDYFMLFAHVTYHPKGAT